MFWSRGLLPLEHEFVLRHFGHSLQSLQPRIRLYLRRLGDTRRALSMSGGRIYLPRSFFEAGQPERVLKLDHPAVAGVFAHELLHTSVEFPLTPDTAMPRPPFADSPIQ